MFIPEEIEFLKERKRRYAMNNLRDIEKRFPDIKKDARILKRPYCLCFHIPGFVHTNFYYTSNKWTVGVKVYEGRATDFLDWYEKQKTRPPKEKNPEKTKKVGFLKRVLNKLKRKKR